MSAVYSLAAAQASAREVAGGKGSLLARLVAAGVRVPDGYVVGVSPVGDASWEAAAASSYDALCAGQGDVPVAVRSSSPLDDSLARSAASVLPTLLGVHGRAAVVEAVRTLRAPSSWSRLGEYAGADLVGAHAPAIVVQALVRARAAGVAFTANPVTGDRRRVLIEVGAGLGDVVTDGLLVPTLIEADRESGAEVSRRPGRQVVRHSYDEATGTVRETRDCAAPPPTLTSHEVGLVSAAALAAEQVLGRPADVEWALEGCGDEAILWVLQARPITTLPE